VPARCVFATYVSRQASRARFPLGKEHFGTIVSVFCRQPGLFAAILLIVGVVAGAPTARCENAEPARPYLHAADGKLDDLALLEAGLVASGVSDQELLTGYKNHFDELAADLAEQLPADATTPEAAEEAFRFLHDRLLTGEYISDCTEVQHAFDRGDYNCVSATLLYQSLCRRHGLTPVAVATATHVRSRFAEHDMDVETTCDSWFTVRREDPSVQFLRTHLQSTRELSDVQLVSKIFYNRGVSLLESRRFAEAFELLETSLELDPKDPLAVENWCASLNNWALAECDASRYEHAIELIVRGLARDSSYAPFLANDLHIHQKWAMALCQRQQFARAVEVLDRAHDRRPDIRLFDQGRFAIYRQWAAALLADQAFDEAWQLFDETVATHQARPEVRDFQSQALEGAVNTCIQSGDQSAAAEFVQAGLRRLPNNAALLEQQRRLTKGAL
jgi:tetratricopeptide (TPR) repeat protein